MVVEIACFIPDKLLALELGKDWVVNRGACGPAWLARVGLKPWKVNLQMC